MAKQKTKKRSVVLTDDKEKNVAVFACNRLNNAVNSIRIFGQCFGDKYAWKPEQIDKAEKALLDEVDKTITNLRTGKKIRAGGISL
jgi:hypothetical protein